MTLKSDFYVIFFNNFEVRLRCGTIKKNNRHPCSSFIPKWSEGATIRYQKNR